VTAKANQTEKPMQTHAFSFGFKYLFSRAVCGGGASPLRMRLLQDIVIAAITSKSLKKKIR